MFLIQTFQLQSSESNATVTLLTDAKKSNKTVCLLPLIEQENNFPSVEPGFGVESQRCRCFRPFMFLKELFLHCFTRVAVLCFKLLKPITANQTAPC